MSSKSKKAKSQKQKFFSQRRMLTILAVSIVLSALIIPQIVISINEGLLTEISIYETDISEKSDGVYNGKYSASGYSASVNVTIMSGYIVKIDILSQSGLNPTRTSALADRIVKYQMLQFDELGWIPNPHDRVFLKAVERALSASPENSPPLEGNLLAVT